MAGRPQRRQQFRRLVAAVSLAACLGAAQAAVPLLPGPQWQELPEETRRVLAPLVNDWPQMEVWRREKWLEIAQRYPKLTPDEQARVQERMRAWAKLTPAQRRAARERYQTLLSASPAQKEALKKLWAEYEALPDEDKQRFLEEAAKKRARSDKAAAGRSIVPASRPPVMPKIPVPATPAPAVEPAPAGEAGTAPAEPSAAAAPSAPR